VPGDVRPAYEHTNQARQILNDAEDDLKDWAPELEDVPSHANLDEGLMPSSASQHQQASVVGDESVVHHERENAAVQPGNATTTDGSRVSSGTSVTTGLAYTE
jgi:hypothetical protein